MINAYINAVLHVLIQTDQPGVKREIHTIWSLTTTQESAPSTVFPLVTSSIYYQNNALKTTSRQLTFVKGVCCPVENFSSCNAQLKTGYPNILCLPGSYCSWKTLVHGRGSRVLGWQYFCLLRGTSAKMGGQGGGRISLRLRQAKIEYDLFSFAAINTFLSNNPSYSWQSSAQESQVMSAAQTKANWRKKKGKKMPLSGFPAFSNTAEASHVSFLLYLQGSPHPVYMLCHDGVLSLFRRSPALLPCDAIWCDENEQKRLHIKKPHKLRNTCLLQKWRTTDGKGLLRIKRKMSSYLAGQMESCWAAIWMPKHLFQINAQRPDEAKGKHQQRTSVGSGVLKQLSKPISIRWCWKKDNLYAEIMGEALAVAELTASPSTRAISHYSPNKVITSHLRKSTLSFCI